MASDPNVPSGLQPIQRFGSASYRGNLAVFAAPTTNALFLGDPVVRVTATGVASGTDGAFQKVDLVAQASNHKMTGAVVGFLGTSPNGAFFAASGTPGPYYKVTNAPVQQYVLVDTDANSEYTIQCTGTPAATVVGQNTNLVTGTGSIYTGLSGWQASATTGVSATAQLTIMGFLQEVGNTVGNKFPKLIVRINYTTEAAGVVGI
jgi:hypothetical protein